MKEEAVGQGEDGGQGKREDKERMKGREKGRIRRG